MQVRLGALHTPLTGAGVRSARQRGAWNLHALARNAGQASTYESLLRRVWRMRDGGGDPRLVRAFVKQLRKKLGDDPDSPTYIVNERGVGYRMPRPD